MKYVVVIYHGTAHECGAPTDEPGGVPHAKMITVQKLSELFERASADRQ
jgi:hypothetical protein